MLSLSLSDKQFGVKEISSLYFPDYQSMVDELGESSINSILLERNTVYILNLRDSTSVDFSSYGLIDKVFKVVDKHHNIILEDYSSDGIITFDAAALSKLQKKYAETYTLSFLNGIEYSSIILLVFSGYPASIKKRNLETFFTGIYRSNYIELLIDVQQSSNIAKWVSYILTVERDNFHNVSVLDLTENQNTIRSTFEEEIYLSFQIYKPSWIALEGIKANGQSIWFNFNLENTDHQNVYLNPGAHLLHIDPNLRSNSKRRKVSESLNSADILLTKPIIRCVASNPYSYHEVSSSETNGVSQLNNNEPHSIGNVIFRSINNLGSINETNSSSNLPIIVNSSNSVSTVTAQECNDTALVVVVTSTHRQFFRINQLSNKPTSSSNTFTTRYSHQVTYRTIPANFTIVPLSVQLIRLPLLIHGVYRIESNTWIPVYRPITLSLFNTLNYCSLISRYGALFVDPPNFTGSMTITQQVTIADL